MPDAVAIGAVYVQGKAEPKRTAQGIGSVYLGEGDNATPKRTAAALGSVAISGLTTPSSTELGRSLSADLTTGGLTFTVTRTSRPLRIAMQAAPVTVSFFNTDAPDLDPITNKENLRLVVVTEDGTQIAELEQANIDTVSWRTADSGELRFTLPMTDDKNRHCKPLTAEVQVWSGRRCIWWGVLLTMETDTRTATYRAATLDWYFTRRHIGRSPRENLFTKSGFEGAGALDPWTFDYDNKSQPDRPPNYRLSRLDTEPSINGKRSLRLSAATGKKAVTERFDADITFKTGTTDLTPAARRAISRLVISLRDSAERGDARLANYKDAVLRITGHTDSIGSLEDNQELSEERAQKVANYITKLSGSRVPSLVVIGAGEAEPIASNDTAEGRRKNNRVEIEAVLTVGTTESRQYASQKVVVTNPRSSRTRKWINLSAWFYIEEMNAPARDNMGVRLIVRDLSNGTQRSLNFPIDNDTPQERWVRCEKTLAIAPDGHDYEVEARLYAISGTIYYDDARLVMTDALNFNFDAPQHQIVKQLVEHAQDPALGKSNLLIGTRHKGERKVKRARWYGAQNREPIRDLIYEFPTLADGMDVGVVHTGTRRWMQTWYPRRGREHKNGLALAYGANIADYRVTIDGTQTANQIIVQAEGEGPDREEGFASDLSLLDGKVFERVYDSTPGSSLSSLDSQAKRGLGRYSNYVVIPQITCQNGEGIRLRDIEVGDILPISIHHNWVDHDGRVRIDAITYRPNTGTIDLELSPWDEWSV